MADIASDYLPESTPPLSDSYLKEFTVLGPQTYLYAPQDVRPNSNSRSNAEPLPDLIIVGAWMGAAPRYVSKYTKVHQARFPGVPILLLQQDGSDLLWRPNSWQLENLKPAVSVIEKCRSEAGSHPPTVLMHLFSNGGAHSACQLAEAYRLYSSAGKSGNPIPISALVLDSLPSRPHLWKGLTAISEMIPKSTPLPLRLLGQFAILTFIWSSKLVQSVGLTENVLLALGRKLNDAKGPFTQGQLRRLYIYSEADKLVPWQEVEAHAQEAMEVVGKERVEMEDFKTSRHVGHVMLDEQKYWNLIEQFWKDCTRN